MTQDYYYYVICPIEDRKQGIPLRKYVFGPYKYSSKAQEISDKVGGWEIVPLPTNILDEAIEILGGQYTYGI